VGENALGYQSINRDASEEEVHLAAGSRLLAGPRDYQGTNEHAGRDALPGNPRNGYGRNDI